MSISYWKTIGENIARGLSDKTIQRFSTGGRLLGRTGAVVGIGFVVFELFKQYKDNIETEPAYKEMMILQEEMNKWISAISCIGRDPSIDREYGSIDEGGAINALFEKKLYRTQGTKAADPKEAKTLIGRSIGYISETENLLNDEQFEEKRDRLIARLKRLQSDIDSVKDYGPIRRELSKIVMEIQPIESGYTSRIYDCSQEIQKTLGSNAAWAAISTATLGLLKKPGR